MASSTITRIKCGQIYILSNDNFSLICEFCERDFFNLEAFRTHVGDHFPEKPISIKIENCESDITSIKQEIQDDVLEDWPVNQQNGVTSSLVECQLLEDQSGQSNKSHPSEETEEDTQTREQNEENNHRGQPNENLDLQVIIENPNENTTNAARKTPLRRSTRKTNEPRIEKYFPKDDDSDSDISETIDSYKPQISSASVTPDAKKNNSKPIRKKGFQCTFCPRVFRQRRDHAEHENIHSGRQPFQCPICFKTFARSQSLHMHTRLHTNDMPHKCPTCDKKFKIKGMLEYHIRENHLPDTDPRRYFVCKPCDIKFDSNARYTYHRTSKHNQDTTVYICDYCQRKFKKKKNLFDHMNMHSKARWFTCQFCNKQFLYRNSKSKHERTQHREIAF